MRDHLNAAPWPGPWPELANLSGPGTAPSLSRRDSGLARETPVFTDQGLTPAGALAPGARVLTRDRGFQPLIWAGQRKGRACSLSGSGSLPLWLGPGQVLGLQDERLGRSHGSEVFLCRAEALALEGGSAPRPLALLLTEAADLIWADGLWLESWRPAPAAMANLAPEERAALLSAAPRLRYESGRAAYARRHPWLDSREARLIQARARPASAPDPRACRGR